jgi:hypothetical protein
MLLILALVFGVANTALALFASSGGLLPLWANGVVGALLLLIAGIEIGGRLRHT